MGILTYGVGITLLALSATSTPPNIIIDYHKSEPVDNSIIYIKEKIREYADKYDVSEEMMNEIVKCESGYNTTIQSGHYHDGVREESYGLVQINLKAHTNITKEQASDIDFSLNFLASNIKAGKSRMWTCYRTLYE